MDRHSLTAREQKIYRAAFTAGFFAGFAESGEGFNQEYPFDHKGCAAQDDEELSQKLQELLG